MAVANGSRLLSIFSVPGFPSHSRIELNFHMNHRFNGQFPVRQGVSILDPTGKTDGGEAVRRVF